MWSQNSKHNPHMGNDISCIIWKENKSNTYLQELEETSVHYSGSNWEGELYFF